MNNLRFALKALALCLWASSAFAESPIFVHLRNQNYDGIKREIELDQAWAHQKNQQRLKPLQIAIMMKDAKLVRFLMNSGAKVTEQHIYLAMNYFLDVSANALDNARPISLTINKKFKPIVQAILAATEGPQVESNIANIAHILDLFCAREELALIIRSLFDLKEINTRETRLLTREYHQLFLQDLPLTTKELTGIIATLLPLESFHHLLKLVLSAYTEQASREKRSPVLQITRATTKRSLLAQEISQAIIERSRSLFIKMPPALWVRTVIMEEKIETLSEATLEMEKLTAIIKISLLEPTQAHEISEKYLLWTTIYEDLIDAGDLLGAFSLALALNSPLIEKKVSPKIYRELPITDMMKSFKTYRELLSGLSHRFHIPAIAIHLRDLAGMKESSLVIVRDGKERLNERALQFYTNFRQVIGGAYQKALRHSVFSNNSLTKVLAGPDTFDYASFLKGLGPTGIAKVVDVVNHKTRSK